jgi:2',3'-cyclic-nucleotide 2'-phosphodiesterase (5'-nucleotidase family)
MAEHFLLLDTGDALIGDGLLGDSTMGEAIIEGMNLMQYDAMALGPKELALGPVVLRERMQAASFPVLSANVLASDSDQLVAQPYVVLEIGGHKVAVIGLTRPPTEDLDNFEVRSPEEALPEVVAEAVDLADTVILLTNLPFETAQELAQGVPDIDLLVAALPVLLPDRPVRLADAGALAVTADQPLPKHTGRRVGRLVAVVASDGSLTNESWASVPMGPEISDDPQMSILLEAYQ